MTLADVDIDLSMGELFRDQREFSVRTFGPHPRLAGVIDHIYKELDELKADPSDVMEWIDILILAADGAMKALAADGDPAPWYSAEAFYLAKMAKNKSRVWPDWRECDPDRAIEHVKGIND